MSTAWQYTTRGRLSTTIKQVSKPVPNPKADEVVVKVKAAALNPVENQM
jgi:NADPH:quinone reductase-like Zn-dependent oxidoreductase